MVTSRPRFSACDVVRVALGLLLLVAAALKAHQLATQPLPQRDLLSSRWFLVLWVEAEIALGLWLLSGLGRRAGWGAALVCFGLFSVVTLHKALAGETSCGCFGVVEVSPWTTLILDVAAVAGLLVFRPGLRAVEPVPHGRMRLAGAVGVFLAAGVPVAILAATYRPAGLAEDGSIVGRQRFVVPKWNMVIVRLGLDGGGADDVWNTFFVKVAGAVGGPGGAATPPAAPPDRTAPPQRPVPVILDTDLDSDCDDLGALALLHALADEGEARILAVITTTDDPDTPPCADAVNTWYGRGDTPIGVLDPARGGGQRRSRYARAVAEACPHDLASYGNAEDAVRLYRRVLAAEEDGSVVVVTVGHLTSLARLLDSKPDDVSPLSGVDLVRRKVRLWSCMGGRYPEGKEPNFSRPDPAATVRAVEAWPTRVIFSGAEIGDAVRTGGRLAETPADHPVRIGYERYFGKGGQDRPSWDQTAVLCGVRGPEPWWRLVTEGHNHVLADGRNVWQPSPDKDHAYLVAAREAARVAAVIEGLMIRPPRKRP